MKLRVSGFTLIEMMIVVAIIGILASLAIPKYGKYMEKTRVVSAQGEMRSITTVLEEYNIENARYPESLDDEELELPQKYLTDPWDMPYNYEADGRSYILYSCGGSEDCNEDEQIQSQ